MTVSLPVATTIGDNTFFHCESLETVSLPAATTIGESAFSNCISLETVSLPAATTIGNYAFHSCPQLATVSLPAATTIGDYTFNGCSRLTTVSLPAATTIGNSVFIGCSQLATVSLPAATTIGDNTFISCSQLATVSLPAATTIGDYTFSGCSRLTTVSLPVATTIGDYTFSGCSQLTTASLPAATTIGNYTFASCANLTTLLLPAPAPSLGTGVFAGFLLTNLTIYTNDSGASGKTNYPATNYSLYRTPSVTLTGPTSVVKASSITLTPSSGGFKASPPPTVNWASDNPAIATVDASGVVTGVATGTVTIRYTVVGTVEVKQSNGTSFSPKVYIDKYSVQAVRTVTVTDSSTPPGPDPSPSTISVTGVTMSKTALDLKTGETGQLSATVQPSNATDKKVTWTSSNPDVVAVDQTGKVTAVGPGTATITAITEDGKKTATCTITVTDGSTPGPTEKPLFTINVADCEIIVTQNEDGTLAVKVRIPFASSPNPALLDTVKMIASSLGLTDISYVWIDAQGGETPVARMAAAPYLEIRGTAANMDVIKDGAVTGIQYTLKNNSTQYVQTFSGGGLKIANMSGYPSPEPTPSGSGSSGCDAGAAGLAGMLALASVLRNVRKGKK